MQYKTLNNGLKIPMVGYGVYKIEDYDQCMTCVLDALEIGYRLIDTAQLYVNEEAVGAAIKQSPVPREEIFITTKVWPSNAGYQRAKQSILDSIEKLQVDYVDCIMIHQPFGDYYGTYRALEELYEQGLIKSVGVSNFYPDRLLDLIHYNNVVPVINQVEAHVFAQRFDEKELMQQHDILMQAWSPLARGQNNLFNHEVLVPIGQKYNKTSAQIALKYLVQNGISVIPKTVNKDRMIQNIDLFDFELTHDELKQIRALDETFRFTDHRDPQVALSIMDRSF